MKNTKIKFLNLQNSQRISQKIILLIMIFLVSCNYVPGNGDTYEKSGTTGVEIDFVSNTPPRELLYRGEEVPFEADVRIRNIGASMTKGGIYISGYDPSIIEFDEVDEIETYTDCLIDVISLGFQRFQGAYQCRELDLGPFGKVDLGITSDNSVFNLVLDNIDIGGALDDLTNSDFFADRGFDTGQVRLTLGEDRTRVDINFENSEGDLELGFRGPHFLSLWSPFNFSENNGQQFLIPGDTPYLPGGGEEFITYHGRVKDMPRGLEKSTQTMMITSCYLYTTFANPTVCVDVAPDSTATKACRPSTYTSRGQAAPIVVTSVTSRPTSGLQMFTINIENRGNGKVINPERMSSCNPNHPLPLQPYDVDRVILGDVFIGNDRLTCKTPYPDQILLTNGKGKVDCWLEYDDIELKTQSAFETPLTIELWYGYSETIRETVKIHRLIG